MRISILVLIGVIVVTLVVALPLKAPDIELEATPELTVESKFTAEPQSTRTPAPTATWSAVTPPAHAKSETELVARAVEIARMNGLVSFDGPPLVAWMTYGEWEGEAGFASVGADNTLVFTVAFPGIGIYQGLGVFPGGGPSFMNGFTVTLDGLTGDLHGTGSGYDPSARAVEFVPQFRGIPTVSPQISLTPWQPITPEQVAYTAEIARRQGLETIGDEPVAQWVTMADWLTRRGMNGSRYDPYLPVLVVAFRGTGYRVSTFLPPATRNPDTAITGLTIAIDGLTGAEIGFDYWFNPPPFEPEHLYIQFLDQWLAAYFPPGATLLSHEPQMMPRFGDMSEYAAVLQRSMNESTYTTEELLSFAKQHARSFGLETISGTPEYYWALHFEYPAGLGGIVSNYRLPVFVAALRGSGQWTRGTSGQSSAFEMDGITLVLNGLTGEVVAVTGAYVELLVPDDAARELE